MGALLLLSVVCLQLWFAPVCGCLWLPMVVPMMVIDETTRWRRNYLAITIPANIHLYVDAGIGVAVHTQKRHTSGLCWESKCNDNLELRRCQSSTSPSKTIIKKKKKRKEKKKKAMLSLPLLCNQMTNRSKL